MKSWLSDNGTEMHSAHDEGKSVVAESFVRTLNSKIYSTRELRSKITEPRINCHKAVFGIIGKSI